VSGGPDKLLDVELANQLLVVLLTLLVLLLAFLAQGAVGKALTNLQQGLHTGYFGLNEKKMLEILKDTPPVQDLMVSMDARKCLTDTFTCVPATSRKRAVQLLPTRRANCWKCTRHVQGTGSQRLDNARQDTGSGGRCF